MASGCSAVVYPSIALFRSRLRGEGSESGLTIFPPSLPHPSQTAFIKQEALEKAREIKVKADEEFAIEKVRLAPCIGELVVWTEERRPFCRLFLSSAIVYQSR
jgi:hypothetical protein